MRLTLIAVLVLAFAWPTSARADQRYRIAVGVADGVGAGAFVAGIQLGSLDGSGTVPLLAGLATMAFAAPIIHIAQGNPGRGGISVGARVLAPVIGMVIGIRIGTSDTTRLWNGPVLGFLAGFVVATAVDVAIASSEDADPATPRMIGFGGAF